MIKFRMFGFGNHQPAAAAPSPETEDTKAPSSTGDTQANPNGKRVLIVDDDLVFLKATAMKLQAAGFQVTRARESSEAITALGDHPTDAVLMDIDFPADVFNGGMAWWDGFQMMSWLRGLATPIKPRFIMVSSSDSEENRKRAQQGGAVAFFQKPVDFEQLIAAVNA